MKKELLIELLERSIERMLKVDDMDVAEPFADSFKYGCVSAEAKYCAKLLKQFKEDKEHDGDL